MWFLSRRFWAWYERHYALNLALASGLFLLQLVHLYWLTTDVVAARLLGHSYFSPSPFWRTVIVLVDYTEIPAIVVVSLVYVNELRRRFSLRSAAYLAFLDVQLLHLFWITDEFVVAAFREGPATFPLWLAWVAIAIDYLELPVIVATIRRFVVAVRSGAVGEFVREETVE